MICLFNWISATFWVATFEFFSTNNLFGRMSFLPGSLYFRMIGLSKLFFLHQLEIIFIHVLIIFLKDLFELRTITPIKRSRVIFKWSFLESLNIFCFRFLLRFLVIVTNKRHHLKIFGDKFNNLLFSIPHINDLSWVVDLANLVVGFNWFFLWFITDSDDWVGVNAWNLFIFFVELIEIVFLFQGKLLVVRIFKGKDFVWWYFLFLFHSLFIWCWNLTYLFCFVLLTFFVEWVLFWFSTACASSTNTYSTLTLSWSVQSTIIVSSQQNSWPRISAFLSTWWKFVLLLSSFGLGFNFIVSDSDHLLILFIITYF